MAECGLSVSCYEPFLGASPDRLAFDVTSKSHGLVEIKCPPNSMGTLLKVLALTKASAATTWTATSS